MMILALAQVAMIQVVAETLDVLALQVLDVLALSLNLMRNIDNSLFPGNPNALSLSNGTEAAGQATRDEPDPPHFAKWEKSVRRVQISQERQRY